MNIHLTFICGHNAVLDWLLHTNIVIFIIEARAAGTSHYLMSLCVCVFLSVCVTPGGRIVLVCVALNKVVLVLGVTSVPPGASCGSKRVSVALAPALWCRYCW